VALVAGICPKAAWQSSLVFFFFEMQSSLVRAGKKNEMQSSLVRAGKNDGFDLVFSFREEGKKTFWAT
jgi:hypothetical protein